MKQRLFCALVVLLATTALAADAPQFRGPHRDGIFEEKGLLKAWPEGGPALAWKAEGIGKGYGSIAVDHGTLYTAGAGDDLQGYVLALGLDGKVKWKANYGLETEEKMATVALSKPTNDGDRLYIQSGLGAVVCMSTKDGKILWQVDAAKEFKGKEVDWVYSESVLVDGDVVFVTPGGPEVSVAALNKMTGATVWTAKGSAEGSAYCSPAIFSFGGHRTLVQWMAETLLGIDVKTGEILWSFHQKVPYDIHANTPVVDGNLLYYTAESGGGVLEVAPDGKSVTSKWTAKDPEVLHHGVILKDGYLYGAGFRKNRKLYCLDLKTGQEKWSTDEIGEASIVYADGMLYLYESPKKGIVHLVKASPEKYEHAGSFTIPEDKDKHWAHPVVANGKLFIRHAGLLYAYDIAAK